MVACSAVLLVSLLLSLSRHGVLALRTPELGGPRGHAPAHDGPAHQGRSVAVLVVGRLLDFGNTTATPAETAAPSAARGLPGGQEATPQDVNPWVSFEEHVLRPIQTSVGRKVDVFLCVGVVSGVVPRTVTGVYNFSVGGQMERLHRCYQEVSASRSYDFYIRTRPDFVYLTDFPPVAHMRANRMYSRFRMATGIAGLTSSHFSWNQCGTSCNVRSEVGSGYMNDDMIFAVPRALCGRVFLSGREAAEWRRRFRAPPDWIAMPHFQEAAWTERLIAAGVLTEPLAITGYPSLSWRNHRRMAIPCGVTPVEKVRCGSRRPMAEVHKNVLTAAWHGA